MLYAGAEAAVVETLAFWTQQLYCPAKPAHRFEIDYLLANLTGVHKAELNLGGRRFSLDVVPVFNDANERLGSAVQWTDRTEEFRAEQEVSQLVDAAVAGDFTKRIEASNKEGFFLKIATGLNNLVDTADKGLRDVTRVLGALAQGDLTQRIDADYQGTFGELKDYSNNTTQSLSRMLGQISEAADTINTAASEIASGNTELSTRTEQQASSLEETAASMETSISEVFSTTRKMVVPEKIVSSMTCLPSSALKTTTASGSPRNRRDIAPRISRSASDSS